jgi:hypothetical protein
VVVFFPWLGLLTFPVSISPQGPGFGCPSRTQATRRAGKETGVAKSVGAAAGFSTSVVGVILFRKKRTVFFIPAATLFLMFRVIIIPA